MATPTNIGTNSVDSSGYALTSTQKAATGTDFYSKVGYGSALAGPVATSAMATSGNTDGATIVGSAVNATAGYGGGTGYGTTAGVYSGATSNYYGSSSSGVPTSTGAGTSDMLGMAQQQLADSQASSISMLMIQDEMGKQNRMFTTASNLMNSRDSMVASIVRNIRSS